MVSPEHSFSSISYNLIDKWSLDKMDLAKEASLLFVLAAVAWWIFDYIVVFAYWVLDEVIFWACNGDESRLWYLGKRLRKWEVSWSPPLVLRHHQLGLEGLQLPSVIRFCNPNFALASETRLSGSFNWEIYTLCCRHIGKCWKLLAFTRLSLFLT